jgi:hypothetical protein
MRHLRRFNESITLDEYNRILDKISELGLESLTKEEKEKLDSFDGNFSKDKPNDVIITNDHGSWTSNDINPKYLNNDSEDKGKKEEPKKEPKQKPKQDIVNKNLNSYIVSNYKGGNGFIVLHKNDKVIVLLEKYIINKSGRNNRVYYIYFKNIDKTNRLKVLKLSYDLTMGQRRNNSNITITDNDNNLIEFNKLDEILSENGMDFGDFNSPWYYIEDNYNSI